MTAIPRNFSAFDYPPYLLAMTPFVVLFLIMPCESCFSRRLRSGTSSRGSLPFCPWVG